MISRLFFRHVLKAWMGLDICIDQPKLMGLAARVLARV